MLRLVTGRIGSGKTSRIYDEIGKRIECGGSVTLIVPEQFSFRTEKKMLELFGAKGADRVDVVSFSFLAVCFLISSLIVSSPCEALRRSLRLSNQFNRDFLTSAVLTSTICSERDCRIL